MEEKEQTNIPKQDVSDEVMPNTPSKMPLDKILSWVVLVFVLLLLLLAQSCAPKEIITDETLQGNVQIEEPAEEPSEPNKDSEIPPIITDPDPLPNGLCSYNGYTTKYWGDDIVLDKNGLIRFFEQKELVGDKVLNQIKGLDCLTYLLIPNDGQTELSDIAPISKLTNLRYLAIDSWKITDLSPLSNLQKLEELMISDSSITNLAPLTSMRSLNWLSLNNNKLLKNISPLSQIPQLEVLSLDKTDISNLTPLTKLNNLRQLFLAHTLWSEKALEGLTFEEISRGKYNTVPELEAIKAANPNLEVEFLQFKFIT
ncbi:MAG: hypothetical protein U9M89_00700 [Patescibacteria group bacterium]|nr:hypothetical protein [Patescibacteria group bacterium]